MMEIHHHQPMAVCIAEKDLRQSLVPMIILETNKRGITNLGILMFILIKTILLIMNKNRDIKELAVFVDCITMCLLSAGKE